MDDKCVVMVKMEVWWMGVSCSGYVMVEELRWWFTRGGGSDFEVL